MYPFVYHSATMLDDAVTALRDHPEAKLIAGGQTLLASLKLRLANPEKLIDLGRLAELRGIQAGDKSLTIGAMTRHADVAASPDVIRAIPSLAALAGNIGDRMVRNLGTLGGSIANNDPAADYPAAVLALNATVITTERRIGADRFFVGMFETALQPAEIIRAVEFPVPRRAAYVKFKHPASRFAMVGVYVAETATGVRIAVTGAGAHVFRVAEMEQALQRDFSPQAIAGISIDPATLNSDMHADATYRAHLVAIIAARAVKKAAA